MKTRDSKVGSSRCFFQTEIPQFPVKKKYSECCSPCPRTLCFKMTFSKSRHGRFRESNVLRHLLEAVVELCMADGLVGADGFAFDAGLITADANKQRSVSSDEWKPEESRARRNWARSTQPPF